MNKIEEDLKNWFEEIRNCERIVVNKHFEKKFKPIKIDYKTREIFQKKEKDYSDFVLEKNKSLGIDRNSDKLLRTGKYPIDKTIDFHGLILDEAFDSLAKEVDYAYNNNLRCLLVITGKGRGTKEGRESIKSSIENWLKMDVISGKIIKYTQAIKKHGGEGAIYILIRK